MGLPDSKTGWWLTGKDSLDKRGAKALWEFESPLPDFSDYSSAVERSLDKA